MKRNIGQSVHLVQKPAQSVNLKVAIRHLNQTLLHGYSGEDQNLMIHG